MAKQTYLKSAFILIFANALVKCIGALFKIPLANIIEEEGMAIFSTAYNFYACLFVIATSGLPIAVSKMVSQSIAKKQYGETDTIFKAALSLMSLIGLAGALVMFLGGKWFAEVAVKSPSSYFSILAIAPAIFFVSLLSAFRGYFQGFSNMVPTALSEVVEALGKLAIGLLLAYILLPQGLVYSSAGAVLGVTAGTFLALLLMVFTYFAKRKKHFPIEKRDLTEKNSTKKVFIDLAKIAIPITIGALVTSLTNVIDTVMIRQRLQTILVTEELARTLTEFYGASGADVLIGKAMSVKPSEILYGAYSGFAVPMFNLPPTLIMSLSLSVVPFISAAFAVKNHKEVQTLSESTLRITMLFSMPCAIGLSFLSQPILTAVYNNQRASAMLFLLGFAVVFVSLVSVTTAMLQGAGKVYVPVFNMLIGGVVKIITNFILVSVPSVNIGGAPISTNLCYLVIAILNIISVKKVMKPHIPFTDFIVKPIIAAFVMGIAAVASYQGVTAFLGGVPIQFTLTFMSQTQPVTPITSPLRFKVILALGIAIFVAVLVYGFMVFTLKLVKRSDVLMLPKGDTLEKILDRFHILP